MFRKFIFSLIFFLPFLFFTNVCFPNVKIVSIPAGNYYAGDQTVYRIPLNSYYIVNSGDDVFDLFLEQESLRDGGSAENANDEDREGTAEKYKVINKKGQIKYLIHRSHPPKIITNTYSTIIGPDGKEYKISNLIIPGHEHICYDGQGTGGKHYFDKEIFDELIFML